jgi:hypothetical protein
MINKTICQFDFNKWYCQKLNEKIPHFSSPITKGEEGGGIFNTM